MLEMMIENEQSKEGCTVEIREGKIMGKIDNKKITAKWLSPRAVFLNNYMLWKFGSTSVYDMEQETFLIIQQRASTRVLSRGPAKPQGVPDLQLCYLLPSIAPNISWAPQLNPSELEPRSITNIRQNITLCPNYWTHIVLLSVMPLSFLPFRCENLGKTNVKWQILWGSDIGSNCTYYLTWGMNICLHHL